MLWVSSMCASLSANDKSKRTSPESLSFCVLYIVFSAVHQSGSQRIARGFVDIVDAYLAEYVLAVGVDGV